MIKLILGVRVASVDYDIASCEAVSLAQAGVSSYICAANVHTVMEAWDSPEFRIVVNSADLVTPDGMPLVWVMRLNGVRNQPRVYGPTLMLHVLEAAAREKIPVGFYGSAPRVLGALLERLGVRFPDLIVGFAHSPPFRPLSPKEDAEIVAQISSSEVRILFVGLGCPKQERWMAEHKGRIQAVMLGVGAAFDFHAGTKPQAPLWVQRIGMEWAYRLVKEPRRLWKRYLHHNPRFVCLALADLLGVLKSR